MFVYWLTSCRDSVIGSFSSVSSSSNTGLDEVDCSSSSFWSIFKEIRRGKKYTLLKSGKVKMKVQNLQQGSVKSISYVFMRWDPGIKGGICQ